jgi:hypothetical protein
MANWCNARLIAVGPRERVEAFAAIARHDAARIFRADMLVSESSPVRRDRTERVADGTYRKRFYFQVRYDTGLQHFVRISKRHRRPSFILVFGDPNVDEYGSALISRGKARQHTVTRRQADVIWKKHGVDENLDDEDEWRFWDGFADLMDLAEAHWTPVLAPPSTAASSVPGLPG